MFTYYIEQERWSTYKNIQSNVQSCVHKSKYTTLKQDKSIIFCTKNEKNPTVASSIFFDVNGVSSFTRAFFSDT